LLLTRSAFTLKHPKFFYLPFMKYLLSSLLCFLLLACKQNPADGLTIPDQAKPQKTAAHVQLPHTQLFAIKPADYTLEPSLIRFMKGDSAALTFIQVNGSDFNEVRKRLQDTIQKMQDAGLDMYYEKQFSMNGYQALFYYGPGDREKYDQLMLTFGDKTFSVMMTGAFVQGDVRSRDEIVKSMLSVVVDKSADPEANAIKAYQMDYENSLFKYPVSMSQVNFYTPSPEVNAAQDPFASSIMVMVLPPMAGTDERKAYALSMIDRYTQSGITISNVMQDTLTINDLPAEVITADTRFKGKNGKIYQVVTGNALHTLLYCGSTYEKTDEYLEEFKRVAKTIRLQEVAF
jgi:hypothetical protein